MVKKDLDIHEFYKEWLIMKNAIRLLYNPEEWAAILEVGKTINIINTTVQN